MKLSCRSLIEVLLLAISFVTIEAQIPRPDPSGRPIPRPVPVATTWNFETGNLQGWTATGTAFDNQPTYGNNVSVRRPGLIINHQGNYWIGTFENHADAATAAGAVQGDAPVGTLLSAPFRVEQPAMSFLVGGGNDQNRLRVELLVQLSPGEQRDGVAVLGIGQRVELADGTYTVESFVTGRNDEVMRREQFDLTRYVGRNARIRILDQATGAWGHINVDDFQFAAGAAGDVWITGMEVSQGVQTYPAASVPLVGAKKTLVRVYAQSRDDSRGAWRDVTARLTVRKGARVRVHTPITSSPSLTIAVPVAAGDRKRAEESFNFLLDYEETLPGETQLEVRIRPVSDRPEADLANNVRIQTVTFGAQAHYWIYGATHAAHSATFPDRNLPAPMWSAMQAMRPFTENLIPVSTFRIVPFPGNPVPSFDHTDNEQYEQVSIAWAEDMLRNQTDPSHAVYVLMPDASCSCGFELGPVMFGHNLGGDAGAEIMAHEVGHLFGLQHVQTQNAGQYPCAYDPYETAYPYRNSWAGPNVGVRFADAASFRLVDTGRVDEASRTRKAATLRECDPPSGEPPAMFDVMSYGAPMWISDFTFRRMMSSPLLAPPRRGGLERESPVRLAEAQLHRKADAREMGRERFRPLKPPAPSKRDSANAPVIEQLSAGAKPGSGKQTVTWSASDADGDPLTYRVDYSADGGQSWMAVQAQLTAPKTEIDFDSLPGSDRALLRVTASDGGRTATATLSEPFGVARKAPLVTIDEKGSLKTSAEQPLVLTASAFDWEDGPLTATQSYRWSSDRQGVLGVGPWIVLSALEAGRHRITVQAMDSDKTITSASLEVTSTGVANGASLTHQGAQ